MEAAICLNHMELLAPAGNLEKLKTAVIFGADAVYLAGRSYGLRAGADNFTREELLEGIRFAHDRRKKVYVTVNIIARNRDLEDLPDYLRFLEQAGADALIVADPGIASISQEIIPNMSLHLSTQANTTNWASAVFWEKQGFSRIILARELSGEEIRAIGERTRLDLEIFVHGAMCISYSGRCLLSHYMTGRSANLGACAQPCRWHYALMEEKRPGEYYPVYEDERGTYIFNSMDLCLLEHIPEIARSGVRSVKIEGRMKSVHYVGALTKVYREALDAYGLDPAGFRVRPEWLEEIQKVSHRRYTAGFFLNEPEQAQVNDACSQYVRPYVFVGRVLDYDPAGQMAVVEQRNHFKLGDMLEFCPPSGPVFVQEVKALYGEGGESLESAPHPRQIIKMPMTVPVKSWTLIRRFAV
jgi:putative protease